MPDSELPANRDHFQKGRAKTGGRKKGALNKATRAWKDFVTAIVSDPEHQEALAEAIRQRPELLFKAVEHAVGKPRQEVDLEQAGEVVFRWAGGGGTLTLPAFLQTRGGRAPQSSSSESITAASSLPSH